LESSLDLVRRNRDLY